MRGGNDLDVRRITRLARKPNLAATFKPTPTTPTPTGQRLAALASCKKRAHKHHWSHKRLKKCKRKANLLPA